MASAGVVLGLMPVILANLGPTLAETSLLTLEPPFLSLLLAIGGPSIYPARPFDYYDPLEAMKQPPNKFLFFSPNQSSYLVLSTLQYVIALSAAINVITVTLELGMKTVAVWEKSNSYLPLTWVLLPIILHIGTAVRLRPFIATVFSNRQRQLPDGNTRDIQADSMHGVQSNLVHSSYGLLSNVIRAETRPCRGFHAKIQLPSISESEEVKESTLPHLLALFLPLLNLVHVMIGVMTFSSLLFIGVGGTETIALRYGISVLAVQLIRYSERAGFYVAYKKATMSSNILSHKVLLTQ
ncbi:hypothetical protein MMC06_000036 [Schaereria dolodes]|nr:hypothetical protein [Schaereria dolodes]